MKEILTTILILFFILIIYLFIMAYQGYKMVFKRRKTFNPYLTSKRSHYYPYKEELIKEYEIWKESPQEEYYIYNKRNNRLYARHFKKDNNKNVILFSHGWHSAGLVDVSFICPFLKKDFNLFVIDHEGHGNSEGKITTFGIDDLDNLKLWIDKINEIYKHECNIILYGVSMGANIVMQAADVELENVKMIIEDSGFVSHYQELKSELKRRKKSAILAFYPFIVLTRVIGKLNIRKVDLTKTLPHSKYPLLFIHGTDDQVVTVDNAYKLSEYTKSIKELYIIDGAAHTYGYQIAKADYEKRCLEFINKHLS